MARRLLIMAGIFGFMGVLAGTFGAHGLRGHISERMQAIYETGVFYHLIHTLALLGTALASARLRAGTVWLAGWMFAGGILVFSGSLYALAITGQTWLGMITPLGGLALMACWVLLTIGAWSWRPENQPPKQV